ncbi:hypothetical protein HK103_007353 [Boothiomyces macroporosus]|uniref:Uncharacterized protein n=1 Tax=Boothiomyces macroporosus TaxID=261099 RepID=A0AAD5UKQ9_9FUNG|nr:hypothetical protein HK103_007353 [Boothiomyces macroporosus]
MFRKKSGSNNPELTYDVKNSEDTKEDVIPRTQSDFKTSTKLSFRRMSVNKKGENTLLKRFRASSNAESKTASSTGDHKPESIHEHGVFEAEGEHSGTEKIQKLQPTKSSKDLGELLSTLQIRIQDQSTKIVGLEVIISDLRLENEQLKNENVDKLKAYNELSENYKQVVSHFLPENDTIISQIKNTDDISSNLQSTIQELQHQLDSTQTKNDNLSKEIYSCKNNYLKEISDLKELIESYRKSQELIQTELNASKRNEDELLSELKNIKNQYKIGNEKNLSLTKLVSELKEANHLLETENVNLKLEVQERSRNTATICKEVQVNMLHQSQNYQTEVLQLSSTPNTKIQDGEDTELLKSKIAGVESEIESLMKSHATEIALLDGKIRDLNFVIQESNQKSINLETEQCKLKSVLEQKQEEIAFCEEEVNCTTELLEKSKLRIIQLTDKLDKEMKFRKSTDILVSKVEFYEIAMQKMLESSSFILLKELLNTGKWGQATDLVESHIKYQLERTKSDEIIIIEDLKLHNPLQFSWRSIYEDFQFGLFGKTGDNLVNMKKEYFHYYQLCFLGILWSMFTITLQMINSSGSSSTMSRTVTHISLAYIALLVLRRPAKF